MTSSRPYLLRAIYQWIVDNGMTPYLLVNAEQEGVLVPEAYINNGKIILNVAPGAVRDLNMEGEHVNFNARFGGVPMQVNFPIAATLAIYARENGRGMVFNEEDDTPPEPAKQKSSQPVLRVVK